MQQRSGTTEQPPRIVVIDDDASMRKALDNLLKSVGFEVDLFASPQEFLQSGRPDRPGCIVLDVRFPGRSGLDMQRDLGEANTRLPIIFITGYGDIPMSVRAMKAGAVEFLTKPFRDQDLIDAIQQALKSSVETRQEQNEIAQLKERYAKLTLREREVMRLLVSGMLTKQIASTLGTSEITAAVHRGQVMHKMQANSPAELGRMAEKLKLSTMTSAYP